MTSSFDEKLELLAIILENAPKEALDEYEKERQAKIDEALTVEVNVGDKYTETEVDSSWNKTAKIVYVKQSYQYID